MYVYITNKNHFKQFFLFDIKTKCDFFSGEAQSTTDMHLIEMTLFSKNKNININVTFYL